VARLTSVINNNKCVLFLKFITFLLSRVDILEKNSCIHKCEASGSITKGLVIGRDQLGELGNECFSFGDSSCSGEGKRVICNNERHKNIYYVMRGRRKEKLT